MHTKLLALAVAAALPVSTAAFAQDSTTDAAPAATGNYQSSQPVGSGNWFIDAQVGRTNGSNHGGFGSNSNGFNFLKGNRGRRTGYGLLGGYRWKVGPDLGLGLEAGYADLGNYRVRNVFNDNDVDQKKTQNALRGWMAGVNGRINLAPQWYMSLHGGYFHANNDDHDYNNSVGQDLGLRSGGKSGRGGYYAGVGTGWDINEHFGVGVHYDYFHVSTGKIHNDVTGEVRPDLKRSTGIVSLSGEYRF